MKIKFLTLLFCLASKSLFAQLIDTTDKSIKVYHVSTSETKKDIGIVQEEEDFGNILSINNYTIFCKADFLLSRIINPHSPLKNIHFEKCSFLVGDTFIFKTVQSERFELKTLHFDNNIFRTYLTLDKIASDYIQIFKSIFLGITAREIQGQIIISFSTIRKGRISIDNSNVELELLKLESQNDSLILSIGNSIIKDFVYTDCSINNAELMFSRDTIKKIRITPSVLHKSPSSYFYRCYIDGEVSISAGENIATVTFDECEFGPNARVTGDNLILEFKGCKKFSTPIALTSANLNSKSLIDCYDTDISNLDFEYLGLFKIANADFEKDTGLDKKFTRIRLLRTSENIISNYERMLAKFKKSGKFSSYENLDMEYQEYKASHGNFTSRVLYYCDKYYWGHGYEKIKVFFWTLAFIGIFWIFNLFSWRKFHSLYPVYHNNWSEYFQRKKPIRYKLYRALRIFLFTTVLFFSFNLNFDKLKQHSNRYIAWILFQYVIGVLSLFFIFNAVVKL